MKQQVRLRMLIPLVVVALAGLAVWKFVLSGDAEPVASEPVPALPATATAGEDLTSGQVAAATPPAPAEPAAEWVAQVNAICEQADAELANVAQPRKPSQVADALEETAEIARGTVAEVQGIAVSDADQVQLDELADLWAEELATGEKVLAALETKEYTRAFTLLDKADRLDRKADKLATELGAPACAAMGDEDADTDANPTIDGATYAVADTLENRRVVVAVLYSPDADVDALALREARAGAEATKAGFVAIDGTKDAAVRVFAPTLDLRETPAILVIRRSGGVLTRLEGFADRQTVAQAVVNARTPA